jgi:hypothetical protein
LVVRHRAFLAVGPVADHASEARVGDGLNVLGADLAGDGEILVDLADFHVLNLLRCCVVKVVAGVLQSPLTGTFR